ncbi:hypothetical protein V8J82_15165 [Gymnodinialimonas sp. 2305UL16-5]|uniref:hypothetical protein n=1 Tax=Gymnodinialimonas mytili TaxID=3126503 RepID=UPI0030A5FF93
MNPDEVNTMTMLNEPNTKSANAGNRFSLVSIRVSWAMSQVPRGGGEVPSQKVAAQNPGWFFDCAYLANGGEA